MHGKVLPRRAENDVWHKTATEIHTAARAALHSLYAGHSRVAQHMAALQQQQVVFEVVDVCVEKPFEGSPTAVVLLPGADGFPSDEWLFKVRQ